MEPAAVLVRAFQIEVGRELQRIAVRAADHGPVGGAGVEPDVQRIAVFLVLGGLVAQQFSRVQRLPGFDAVLLDALGHLLQQLNRARMQLAGFAVHEERHRHAPLALARQRPVRAMLDHAEQTWFAPGREEAGRLDGCQRGFAQGRAAVHRGQVHPGEPLRGGAIDDGRLMAPAMHVAVAVLFDVQQRAGLLQRLDHARIRVPDFQAAEERQALGVAAVAHHRIDDVGVVDAVALAGHEVLDTVGGR